MLAVFCIYFALGFAIDYRLRALAADDSFIHMRIAHHLLETGHAYFNIHERVMVTSSPVWTLLLALTSHFTPSALMALPLVAFSIASACAMTFLIASHYASTFALTPLIRAFYLLLSPALIFLILLQSSIQQMETPLAVALMFAGCYALEKQKDYWLSLFVLAAFTRYEYFVVAICIFAFAAIKKKVSGKALLLASIAAFAGISWLLLQYRTVVPNTIRAKAVGYIITYWDSFAHLGISRTAVALLCVALIAMLLDRATDRATSQPSLPNVLVCIGLVLYALYVMRRTFIFPWYPALAMAPTLLGLILGLMTARRVWARTLIAAALIVLLWGPKGIARREVRAFAMNQPWQDVPDYFSIRVAEYRIVGRSIYQVCPSARLMTTEIGGLGDGFKGEILDGFGLATPSAMKYHPMRVPEERSYGNVGAIPIGFVREAHPDIIVSYDLFAEDMLRKIDRETYSDLVYQPLPPVEMGHYHQLDEYRLHILVAKDGACSPEQIDATVQAALQNN